MHILNNVASSIGGVIKPAGYDTAQGIISVTYGKDVTDPQWKDDAGVKEYDAFIQKWYPDANRIDGSVGYGMMVAKTLVQVLKQCGDDLTRENVMKQAASLKDFELGLLLPGIKINTSATDFYPIEQEQLMKFQGETWVRFGEIIAGEYATKAHEIHRPDPDIGRRSGRRQDLNLRGNTAEVFLVPSRFDFARVPAVP